MGGGTLYIMMLSLAEASECFMSSSKSEHVATICLKSPRSAIAAKPSIIVPIGRGGVLVDVG